MRTRIKDQRYIAAIFLTILITFCGQHLADAENPENSAPVFTDGTRAKRSIAENTPAGAKIGAPVAATDADGDTLTYSKGWVEGAGFSIDSATGQLRTKAPLDYETKNQYSFAVFANDGNGGRVVIPVTINVTDVDETPVNNAPIFTDGDSTTRSIAENTAAGVSIGAAVAATDADNDTLTYSLGGTDAAAFRINSTTGHLQTKAALDYETKTSYSVTVSVSDGKGASDSITVTISVSNVNEAPSFANSTATRSIAENTASGTNIGAAVVATDVDANTTLTYNLGGTDASSFSIVSTTGQLQTKAALNFESKTAYSVTVTASDGGNLSDTISTTITVTDVSEKPIFAPGGVTLTIAENTASGRNIGKPITATDPDSGDTLTYSLRRGDAESFSIDANTGQVRTKAALDYETKNAYTDLVVRATDSTGLIGATRLTIKVTDVNENRAPEFSRPYRGGRTSRSVAENTAPGKNIGEPFTATDADNDTLTYTLAGPDASSFSIVSPSGQLKTKVALDYETKSSYFVVVIVSDGNGGRDGVSVTINVTDVNENRAPVFTDGNSATRAIAENTASGQNIGSAVAATDADNDRLIYTLNGTDAAAFSIVRTSGQLQTNAALDYETKSTYSVTVSVSDRNGGRDSITVTINVTDVNENRAPVFADGDSTTRSIAENTVAGENIGSAVAATDADNDTLTYSLGGTDAAAFSIVSTTGQLQTKAALDYETKTSYSVTVSVSDGNGGSNSIAVPITVTDINEEPVFAPGGVTLTIAENTASGRNIGKPITATDPDSGDTLTYSLQQGDADSFRIDADTGQVRTHAALDYETKNAYTDLMVRATDSTGLRSSTRVTITVTDVNDAPVFTDGATTTRAIAENTAANTNIGVAVAATDQDVPANTLTYSLGGTDASSFSIVSTSGQLQTNAALDYETKTSYAVSVSVSDGNGESDSIPVIISVSNVNEAPNFTEGDSTTRSVAENTAAGESIGSAFAATDVDANTTLTYTLGGTDASSFSIVSTSGQLQTNAALDYETKSSYTVSVSVSDGKGGSDSILVTITVTDVSENRAPVFTDGDSATRSIAENTASGQSIGTAVAATDADNDTLTYSLGGTDAAAFSIVRTTGQLQTSAALDYETKSSYSISVSVSDGKGGSDSITVTITVTDVNENRAPVFTDGSSTTRTIAENTASGQSIGFAVAATDADNDTLTYSLGGTDASSFSIVSTSGQLQTNAALDYETRTSYAVSVSVSDGNGESNSINVTINVTDVGEKPVFAPGGVTLTVAENTASGTNIGDPITATDPDSGDTLTYSLQRGDADSFRIDANTGQVRTHAALDYETKDAYTDLVVRATDSTGLTGSTRVTINVTDVENRAPVFADGDSTTRGVVENTASGVNIGSAVAATDADNDTLTYTLSGTDASAFSIVSTTGQLQTKAALDSETKSSYSVTVSVSDGNGGSDSITVTINVTKVNSAPIFTEGSSATRSIAENTPAATNIGAPVAATDPDGDTLDYMFFFGNPQGNPHADFFTIDRTSGQIKTSAALDFETKTTYTVELLVVDSSMTDTIAVTINVTDVNEAPVFTEGDSTTRKVLEDALTGTNIGTPVAATDIDTGDVLTYTLGGTDAAAFSIVSTTGQLQNNTALDIELKSSYSVTITASDGVLTDSIDVTINVTDNHSPVFTDGDSTMRAVAEDALTGTNIGTPVAATDIENDTLTYSLGGTDAEAFSIVSTTGQLQTKAALDYETKTSYAVTVSVSDGKDGSDSIPVTISVSNVNDAPVFTEGDSTTRTVVENIASGANFGSPVTARDVENDTLTYSLGGTDAEAFSILSINGQLRTSAALDYETKASYAVTVSVSDSRGGSDSIPVTISVSNVNEAPLFTDGDSTTRSIAENTAAGFNIGSVVSATDDDNDVLTYTLGGTDAAAFSIVSTTGQIRTSAALDYETKTSYAVTVSVSDGNGEGDSIPVTISVSNVNEAPLFTDGDSTTRSIAENTAAGFNIGSVVSATDVDNDVLTYTLGGTDASSFSIVSTTGQIRTSAALDSETKSSYSVSVSVSDGNGGSDSITVTITVTDGDQNRAPLFTDGNSTPRTIAENTAASVNIGTAVAATDVDNDTLTYSLGGTDAAAFSIVSTTGQLQTNAALDYETKSSYSVTVFASDGNGGSDRIAVTITVTDVNEKPVFAPGGVTLTVSESAASGRNIGDPITATDPDWGDTLTYSLLRGDADSFRIDANTGQVRTHAALDYETKNAYTDLVVRATDSTGLIGATRLTINVTEITPVWQRTPQVRDAIVAAVPDVDNARDVTKAHLSAITSLTISGSEIRSVTSDDVSGLNGMTDFVIWGGFINFVPADLFKDKTSLTRIVINGNYLSHLPAGLFDGLTNLESLALRANNLRSLPSGIFDDLTALTRLDIGANNFTNPFPDDLFEHNTALTFLSVGNVPSLSATIFEHNTALTELGISEVAANLPSGIFDDLTNLTHLGLGFNGFTSLPSGIFDDLTALTNLNLPYNPLTSLPSGIFDDLTALEELNLQGNQKLASLPSGVFNNNTALTKINLSHSKLTSLPSFSNNTALEELNSSYNALTSLPSGIFDNNTALTNLDLTFTELTSLPSDIFDNNTALTNLNLGHNELTSLPSGIFDNNTALEELKLFFNEITDVSEVESLTSLTTLSVFLNPISDYGPLKRLKTANPGVSIDIDLTNNPPAFTDGTSTTRTIAENTAAGTNIGSAVSATDADGDTLRYNLGGTDADSFDIVSTSGQLQTKTALDFETKNSYTVTVTVWDSSITGGDRITVTINVTDVAGAAPSVETAPLMPATTALLTNFPNPFNPETWIPYQLAKPAEVTLTLYDIRGVVVRRLKLGHQAAGFYQSRSRAIHWDGRNNIGEKVASGVYFYTLTAGEFTATRKLLIRK